MMNIITTLEIQKNNKERVNVYLDGDYAFSVPLIEAARLSKGQTLTEDDIAALKTEDAVARAVDRAVRFLSYRPRSLAEVRRNLKEKAVDEAVIEAAVERLSALGYVDDAAFARFWVENRTSFKPLGVAALRYELRQKGVTDSVIESVLSDFDAGDSAYQAAQTRVRRLRGLTERDFRAKIGSFLQRRGFSYDVIGDTVSRLIEELRESETDYFAGDDNE